MKKIKIKYHNKKIEKNYPIKQMDNSDWIDLRAGETVTLKKGDSALISLGVSMELPKGYEALVIPRSSTFKKHGIIQTNHVGLIDNSYNSDTDIWKYPVYAMRNTTIHEGDRVCQFRIQKSMGKIKFNIVEELNNNERGGFGSTGVQ